MRQPSNNRPPAAPLNRRGAGGATRGAPGNGATGGLAGGGFAASGREAPANSDDAPVYPSLKRRTPAERADAIIVDLKEAILNPGRLDGSTGLAYGDWAKIGRAHV